MVQGSGQIGELLGRRRRRRRRRRHLGIQVDIQARKLYLEFLIWFLGRGERYTVFENGDRGSTQNFDTNLMSIVVWPGKPFSKKCLF